MTNERMTNVQARSFVRSFCHLSFGFRHSTSDPDGTRTRVTGVKGRCPRPLDDGAGAEQASANRKWSATVARRHQWRRVCRELIVQQS